MSPTLAETPEQMWWEMNRQRASDKRAVTLRSRTERPITGWHARTRPSRVWAEVDRKITWASPGQFVRDARSANKTWQQIGVLIYELTGVLIRCPGSTCAYWANVDYTEKVGVAE